MGVDAQQASGRKWSMGDLRALFDKYAVEIAPIYDNYPETIAVLLHVDEDTNRPYFIVRLPEGQETDLSAMPTHIGQGDEAFEVRTEFTTGPSF